MKILGKVICITDTHDFPLTYQDGNGNWCQSDVDAQILRKPGKENEYGGYCGVCGKICSEDVMCDYCRLVVHMQCKRVVPVEDAGCCLYICPACEEID